MSSAAATEWKREISARVQAHRSRRQTPAVEPETRAVPPRLAGVAAAVAERYASAPSYSQYLAKVCAPSAATQPAEEVLATVGSLALEPAAEPQAAPREEAGPPQPARAVFPPELEAQRNAAALRHTRPQRPDEDAFAPVTVEPDTPIAPKLIEFPRQLVASRRARPRLAEGPLREEAAPEQGEQLRIFEVEPEQISRQPLPEQAPPAGAAAMALAEWRYIQLDRPLLTSPIAEVKAECAAEPALAIAPLSRRAMAAALDACLVGFGLVAFGIACIAVTPAPPSGLHAALAAAAVFFALYAGYQWLFLSLADSTPGMRYARLALCTFADENPDRRQRRARVGASLLAAAAAGLGYAWIWFDAERLGWADRISHTYQRCY